MMRSTFLAVLLLLSGTPAAAETLLVERAQREPSSAPTRGMTMGEVERRHGQPTSRLEPAGGQKRQWPSIHRWVYPGFTVYFERSRVIDTVINRATAAEVGPKPVR